MKAVILAGGRGTRLQEETDVIPKPMVRVGGLPLIEHIMRTYAAHGVTEFVVALGYRGDIVKSYFAEHSLMTRDFTVNLGTGHTEMHAHEGERWDDWRVHLVDTGLETMTGGRLRRLRAWIGNETFCMTYGDGLADVDIAAAIAFHREHGASVTLTAVHPPPRWGRIVLDGARVAEFREKPLEGDDWINGRLLRAGTIRARPHRRRRGHLGAGSVAGARPARRVAGLSPRGVLARHRYAA